MNKHRMIEVMEEQLKSLINENDLAYMNKHMFERLHKKWEWKYHETDQKITQLDKELAELKNEQENEYFLKNIKDLE